jgi:hypothetical protein
VSFPGGNEYEQYSAEFELVAEDVTTSVLDKLNLIERMFAFNTLVSYQGLLFQYLKGYIDKESLDAQSQRLFGMLNEKLEKVVKELLRTNGISTVDKKKTIPRIIKTTHGIKKAK